MKRDPVLCTSRVSLSTGVNALLCPHLADDEVVGYIHLALTDDEEARVWGHLQDCSQCSSDMERLLREAAIERVEVNEARMGELRKRLFAISNDIEERTLLTMSRPEGEDMKDFDNQSGDLPANGAGAPAAITSFAQEQISLDTKQKEIVAQWAAENFRLTNGAGVFFDAGSSCLKAWEALREQIARRDIRHINVVTNNFMILQDWASSQFARLLGTVVEMAGESFDALHLALYGPGIKSKLMSGTFRPAVIYIGTSGIEFDEHGNILFGFHANEPERQVKELLFQSPCKARVILATARKIGDAGGVVFDLLSLVDEKTPLFLLTTPPQKGGREQELYERALDIYSGDRIQETISAKGLNFQWVEVRGPREAVNLSAQVLGRGDGVRCG